MPETTNAADIRRMAASAPTHLRGPLRRWAEQVDAKALTPGQVACQHWHGDDTEWSVLDDTDRRCWERAAAAVRRQMREQEQTPPVELTRGVRVVIGRRPRRVGSAEVIERIAGKIATIYEEVGDDGNCRVEIGRRNWTVAPEHLRPYDW